jgi:hypothetical protein
MGSTEEGSDRGDRKLVPDTGIAQRNAAAARTSRFQLTLTCGPRSRHRFLSGDAAIELFLAPERTALSSLFLECMPDSQIEGFAPNVKDEPRTRLARAVLLGARNVTAVIVGSGALLGHCTGAET